MTSRGSVCCCCGSRVFRLQQVAPAQTSEDDFNSFIEVRSKRWLNVYHVNVRPRDATFCKELQLDSKYEQNGYQVTSRPTTGNINRSPENNHDIHPPQDGSHLPNCVLPSSSGKNPPTESGRKSSCSSPHHLNVTELHVNRDIEVSRDERTFCPITDQSNFDRGHSAASVAFSLMSRHSNVPSPPISASPCFASHKISHVDRIESGFSRTHSQTTPNSEMVLFFIHGVGGSSDTWKAQTNYFTSLGYEIVAPDLIGHGFSMAPDKKKAYHFEEISKDLEAVFDKFCKRRNVIIAHSYGCSFASVLARKRSRRVTKIVLISGGGPTPLAPQPGVFSLPACLLVCVRPCLDCGFKKSAFHKTSKVHSPKDQAFDIPTYVLSHTMNGQLWMEGDKVFHNWLNVGALLIYGKHDKLVTLEEEMSMQETIYGSKLEVVEGASHMVMMEQPRIVNSLIHDFLLSGTQVTGQTVDVNS